MIYSINFRVALIISLFFVVSTDQLDETIADYDIQYSTQAISPSSSTKIDSHIEIDEMHKSIRGTNISGITSTATTNKIPTSVTHDDAKKIIKNSPNLTSDHIKIVAALPIESLENIDDLTMNTVNEITAITTSATHPIHDLVEIKTATTTGQHKIDTISPPTASTKYHKTDEVLSATKPFDRSNYNLIIVEKYLTSELLNSSDANFTDALSRYFPHSTSLVLSVIGPESGMQGHKSRIAINGRNGINITGELLISNEEGQYNVDLPTRRIIEKLLSDDIGVGERNHTNHKENFLIAHPHYPFLLFPIQKDSNKTDIKDYNVANDVTNTTRYFKISVINKNSKNHTDHVEEFVQIIPQLFKFLFNYSQNNSDDEKDIDNSASSTVFNNITVSHTKANSKVLDAGNKINRLANNRKNNHIPNRPIKDNSDLLKARNFLAKFVNFSVVSNPHYKTAENISSILINATTNKLSKDEAGRRKTSLPYIVQVLYMNKTVCVSILVSDRILLTGRECIYTQSHYDKSSYFSLLLPNGTIVKNFDLIAVKLMKTSSWFFNSLTTTFVAFETRQNITFDNKIMPVSLPKKQFDYYHQNGCFIVHLNNANKKLDEEEFKVEQLNSLLINCTMEKNICYGRPRITGDSSLISSTLFCEEDGHLCVRGLGESVTFSRKDSIFTFLDIFDYI